MDESDGGDHGVVLLHKMDFDLVISSLHFRLLGESCLSISIYRFVSLLLVHPILEVNVQLLESEYVNGCREGNSVSYVHVEDNHGRIFRSLRMSCPLGVINGRD